MESPLAFFTLFSFVLLAITIDARKDPGEYWQGVMKDQPMPEAIKGLVHHGSASASSLPNKKTECHTSTEAQNKDQLVQDFEHKEGKPFVKDFEPRPSLTAYRDDVKQTEDNSFLKDFEPRPSITAYDDDIKQTEENSFVKDFKPRPSATVYNNNDVGLEGEKSFVNDFEPRPNLSVYQG